MTKKQAPRLDLNRETVRELTEGQALAAAGGQNGLSNTLAVLHCECFSSLPFVCGSC